MGSLLHTNLISGWSCWQLNVKGGADTTEDFASWVTTLHDVNGQNSVDAFPASLQRLSPSFRNAVF